MTVKDIAQMLQSFGTELAEAELPEEGKAIERLLQAHTEKYKKLKVRSYRCCGTRVMLNVTVSRRNRRLVLSSPHYDSINLFFICSFLTGCNQVGVKGGSSSSLKFGDLRDGGRGPVGRPYGLGDGTEASETSSGRFLLRTSSLFMFFLNGTFSYFAGFSLSSETWSRRLTASLRSIA